MPVMPTAELVEHALVELVEVEHRRSGSGEVVGRGAGVEHAVERGAHVRVQAEGGEVGAPGQQVDQREPRAGRVGPAAAGAVR